MATTCGIWQSSAYWCSLLPYFKIFRRPKLPREGTKQPNIVAIRGPKVVHYLLKNANEKCNTSSEILNICSPAYFVYASFFCVSLRRKAAAAKACTLIPAQARSNVRDLVVHSYLFFFDGSNNYSIGLLLCYCLVCFTF